MTEHTHAHYPAAVRRALDTLPAAARAAAESQLPFARGLDDQLTVVADAWLCCEAGSDSAGAARRIASTRRRESLDGRRAGRAVDIGGDHLHLHLPFGLGEPQLVEQDPLAALLAGEAARVYREGLREAGIAADAAPATVGTQAALATADVAVLAHRCARSVQSRMRGRCRAELGGQGTLPGVPPAGEVYRARALGGAQ